ncbi:cell wall hydrolase [Bacillus haynesii]|uniref:cell wall hydrolase n=2 Tax=Bacillus haynesii TaxID=1925021 RepID=UPI002282B880|nr:cell wall hydrolase [Bacillus haynesii]MCY7925013.1 cell wall hydrolase [Bacillus haynesii]MCY8101400.1 cell wall hydrolase [Bacillus haynesii]MCY8470544.1 cell wall hydrolase [Bacillus haynesii]MCY8756339.1 cell wall hydrolase [Bacillus haynesii]MCY8772970.1 cell wall hydrolase [Bacillus haynesii]
MKSKFAALAAFLICMLPAARIEHAQAVMLFSKKDKQEMERLMESLKQEENPAFSQLTDEKSFVEAAYLPAEEEEEKEEVEEETTDLTHKEKDLLSRLVHAEAKGESFEGKVAVANVVLNRVEDGRFPDSVKSVIYQRNAFEPVLNGSIEKKADRESVEAVEEAVDQNKKETDALFFYNPDIASDDWIKTRKVVKRIGNHVFAI